MQYTEVDYWTAWKEMFKNLNDAGIYYYRNGFAQTQPASPVQAEDDADAADSVPTIESNVKSDSEDDCESEFDKLKLD